MTLNDALRAASAGEAPPPSAWREALSSGARTVAAAVAVVGRRPHRHQRLVGEHVLVALHDKLVCARDEFDGVGRVELCDDVAAEEVAGAARREPPPVNVLRIRPHQVAHRAVVRHLLLPVDDADLVERVDRGREAAVDAEDLVLDDGREREVVEDLGAIPPHVDRTVLAQALVVEAVDLRDLPALVVASDERDAVGVAHLEREQQQKRLDRVEAAVDEVTHEEVVGVGHVTAHLEELLEVVELAVNVAADLHVCEDGGARQRHGRRERRCGAIGDARAARVRAAADGRRCCRSTSTAAALHGRPLPAGQWLQREPARRAASLGRRAARTHRDGRVDTLHVALLYEDLARLCTQRLDLSLFDVLAAPQLLDLPVQVRAAARHLCGTCPERERAQSTGPPE